MHGFKPAAGPTRAQNYANGGAVTAKRPKAAGFKSGGLIRGPGTGTSDEVPDEVPEGTFIMPADSTKAIGEDSLEGMGMGKVPVNLSNGEFKLPPEQVHAVGVQALEQMKGATHTPVPEPQGFKPQMFFANGGDVRRDPVVGTRGPMPSGTGGGLSPEAVAQAMAKPQAPVKIQASGMGALKSNPVTNPQGVLRDRMAASGFANGGVVEDEKKRQLAQTYTDGAMMNERERLGTAAGAGRGFTPASVDRAQPAPAQPPAAAPMAKAAISPTNIYPQGSPSFRPSIYGPSTGAAQAASPAKPAPSALDLDPQVQADRGRLGAAWDTVKDMNSRAGAAIADIGTLPFRAVAGAYDTAVARPLRAAGAPVGFVSPYLAPDGADLSSMTPFYDEIRKADAAQAGPAAPGANAAPLATATAPAAPTAPTPAAATAPGQIPNDPSFDALRATLKTSSSRGFTAGGGALPAPNDANNVTRVGNSYSGQDITQGFTVNGRAPGGGGQPSAQSQVAAQGLSDRYAAEAQANPGAQAVGFQPGGGAIGINGGGVGGPASADKFRAQVAQSNAQTAIRDGLNSTNPRVRAAAMQAMTALQGDATQLEGLGIREAGENQRTNVRDAGETGRTAMRDTGETARTVMRESGDDRRTAAASKIANGRLELERTAQGFQSRAAARQEQMQAQYDAATTPEQKAAIVKRIQDLSGKDAGGSWKAVALQGGTDAMGNKTEGVLAAVNERTGEVKRLDSPQQAQAARPIGTRSVVAGKTAVWDGKQWNPQ